MKDKKSKITFQERGFTLVEILVSTAIFASALVIIAGIFVFASRAQQKTSVIERVQSDARYSMETMVREVRAGSIDYASYDNAITLVPEEVLSIRDVDGEVITFFKGECEEGGERQCLKVSRDGASADITSTDATVLSLHFYISPRSNPFWPIPRQVTDCFSGSFDQQNNVCLCEEDNATAQCYPDQVCEMVSGAETIFVCRNPVLQPRVTISLITESVSDRSGEQKRVELQTTVSTKQYEK